MSTDTIAAIATPLGEGGIAVIRISGEAALSVADDCFRPIGRNGSKPSAAKTHTVHYGQVKADGEVIDEVMLTVFRAPRSFTREDVVEISCHGGILSTKLTLDAVLAAGARLADPGEFTKRAFLGGRIDLAQAEAVSDLIHSRTELALQAANEQLAGKLSSRINSLRDDFIKILAHVEAHIDFPDEDIDPDTTSRLVERIDEGIRFMDELLRTAREGRILRRGIRAAIVGRPNAGKSSLLNQLLGHERAIVSRVPGTTRDTIEETANIRGIPVIFIDTAGIRESADEIEREGVRRSRASLEQAELILHVVDLSEALDSADTDFRELTSDKKRLVIGNKCDLEVKIDTDSLGNGRVLQVSCTTGEGIESLKDAIKEIVWSGRVGGEMLEVMINSRHQDALNRARGAAIQTRDALAADQTLEIVAMELRIAVNAVGEIVGKTTTEDLLDSIFSQFCLGK